VVPTKNAIIWVVATSTSVEIQHFRGLYNFHLQGLRVGQTPVIIRVEAVWRSLCSQRATRESEHLCEQNLDKTYINYILIKQMSPDEEKFMYFMVIQTYLVIH
jgi:hypothetical protein